MMNKETDSNLNCEPDDPGSWSGRGQAGYVNHRGPLF